MGIAYDGLGSSLVWESERGIWKAGRRCPDICLTRPSESTAMRLYSLISYGKFFVLMMGHSQDWDESYGDIATCVAIEPPGSAPESSLRGEEMQKMAQLVSEDFATAGDKFQVVIRPDMYIGFVGEGKGWKDYLDSLFVPLH
jgi:phenol 2-monooxygenase